MKKRMLVSITAVAVEPLIPIEKSIPIPRWGDYTHTGLSDTLRCLCVGDSFVYHNQAMHQVAKDIGIKIITRKIGDQQYRVWRIA